MKDKLWLSSQTLGTVVFPGAAGSVGIAEELLGRCPVVAHGDVAAALVGVEVEPVVGVVDVGGRADAVDAVLLNERVGLRAEGVDACAVVHVLGVVVDEVSVYLIVLHTDQIAIPTPAERDTRVGNIVDGVVIDVDI